MKKINIKDTTKMSGIYLIEYPNKKIYIGQAQNIHLRILEHNSRARNGHRGDGKKLQLCDMKIKQYMPEGIQEYYVLEECPIDELDLKENYWISYYNTLDKNIGYNILGYDISKRRGVNNPNASLNIEQLEETIDLLKNHYELSYQNIADKVGTSLKIVQNINWGKSYIDDNLIYPIRDANTHISSQKNEVLDYFQTYEDLLSLKEDLKYSWWLSIETDLIKKYNIPLRIMHDINTGKKFNEAGNYSYPIRKKNIRNKNNLTKNDILNILYLLRNTTKSMNEIGKQFNFARGTISNINLGLSYLIKDYDYPARKTISD